MLNTKKILSVKALVLEGDMFKLKKLIRAEQRPNFDGLDEKNGVYVFWWTGDSEKIKEKLQNSNYILKGPHNNKNNNQIKINFTENWINNATHNDAICLYVGKSTNIKQRILGHVRHQTKNIWGKNTTPHFNKKPNTVSQLRIGIERVFGKSMQEEILENVSVSIAELPGEENVINRFYLENKLIAELYPIFNIDAER